MNHLMQHNHLVRSGLLWAGSVWWASCNSCAMITSQASGVFFRNNSLPLPWYYTISSVHLFCVAGIMTVYILLYSISIKLVLIYTTFTYNFQTTALWTWTFVYLVYILIYWLSEHSHIVTFRQQHYGPEHLYT